MADENKKLRYRGTRYLGLIIAIIAIVVTIIIWLCPIPPPPPPDFSISIDPMLGAIQAGGVIQTTISVMGINGYDHTVSLSASGQPPNSVISFVPPFGEAKPSYTSTVTINVDTSVPAGVYTIITKGTGADGKEHGCNYILTVTQMPVTPTSTPAITPTPTITPAPSPEIRFTYPKEGDKFPLATRHTVEGTTSNVSDDLSLWIVTVAPNNMWYPNTPVVIFKDTWSAKIWIGTRENVDEEFYIHAILADENADTVLQDYMDESRRKGSWPGLYSLPKGAKIYDKVKAIGIVK